ncbi:MAG: PIG-L family deacetylase [Planctomycetes bacterium]|nr:PIG-L family deacetylase [Planctomycetota bacterium]MBL7039025.1 PIG-L family deacetylase [Pirellulaceae bacterium]
MKKAIAIAAHPDDIEFFMSGTLMLLRDAGYEIHYINLANGSCGSMEHDAESIASIRRSEAQAAAASIGAVFHESICNDLEIFYERPLLAKVASVVREVAPEILLTHSPSDYMEDHMNACRLAVTAAFCRGMPNFPVEPQRPPVDQKVTVYHAQPYSNRDPLRQTVHPDLFVDTTDVIDRKVQMLAHHKSQKEWLDKSQGMDSYLHTLRELDREVGSMSGVFQFAEGWRRHLHLGFCDENDDPLSDALPDKAVR